MNDTTLDGWVAASLARLDEANTPPWTDARPESERTGTMSITIESAGNAAHVLRFGRDGDTAATIQLTQGEMLDLWGKIGAYFNLAGMGEGGERPHEHRYCSQVLRHSHDGGSEPHGYYQHAEDFPQEAPGPDETYNGRQFGAGTEGTAR